MCTAVRDGDAHVCDLRSNYGCERSAQCRLEGACTWTEERARCEPTSDDDCARGILCRDAGICRFDPQSHACE